MLAYFTLNRVISDGTAAGFKDCEKGIFVLKAALSESVRHSAAQ